jgi:predicted lactoylglutathione lyase
MFERVTVHAADLSASEAFYATVLAVLGFEHHALGWGHFSLAEASSDRPVTRRLHIGFAAGSRADVDAFWEAGTRAGYVDDGEPGPRPEYGPDYYGGFLLDPDGNSAEAVHHARTRPEQTIDHLWIRVADVAASRAFYTGLGLPLGADEPERVQIVAASGSGSFSLVAGTPTEHATMALHGGSGPREAVDPDGNRVELVP